MREQLLAGARAEARTSRVLSRDAAAAGARRADERAVPTRAGCCGGRALQPRGRPARRPRRAWDRGGRRAGADRSSRDRRRGRSGRRAHALIAAAGSLLVDWGFVRRQKATGSRPREACLRGERSPSTGTGSAASTFEARRCGGRSDSREWPRLRTRQARKRTNDAGAGHPAAMCPRCFGRWTHAPDPRGPLLRIPPGARRRFARGLPAPVLATAVAVALGWWWVAALGIALTAGAVLLALDRFRQLGHRFHGPRVVVREGSLLRHWTG